MQADWMATSTPTCPMIATPGVWWRVDSIKIAQARGATSYASASAEVRQEIAGEFSEAKLAGGAWDEVNVARAFAVVMRSVLAAFYSHPWAWNEIGFGGPAYPRGYARLGIGMSESWEGEEAFDVDPVADVKQRGLE